MAKQTLEQRVAALEKELEGLMVRVANVNGVNDWKSSVGMFTWNEMNKQVDEEIRLAREKDREKARKVRRSRRKPGNRSAKA